MTTTYGIVPSAALQPFIAASPVDTVLTSYLGFLGTTKLAHLINLPTTTATSSIAAYFATATPATNAAVLPANTIVQNVRTTDFYTAPSTTDMSQDILPSIMRFMLFFCKQATVYHMACRVGNIPQVASQCTFDAATTSACNAHLTEIGQMIQRRVPFADSMTLSIHMQACKDAITEYCRLAGASAMTAVTTSQTASLLTTLTTTAATATAATTTAATTGVPQSALVAPAAQTNAIFNSAPMADVIYNCMSPWLILLFISSFINQRKPGRFVDMWIAQYLIDLTGYIFVKYLRSLNASTDNDAFLLGMQTSIATHMSLLSSSQARLDELTTTTVTAIRGNLKDSGTLDKTNDKLEFRRKNMDIMGSNYLANKNQSKWAQTAVYVTVGIYAALTICVAGLMISSSLAHYALILCGVVMVVIVVYASVLLIRSR